ncbi:N-acetylmuramoyl-L-alanine amidase [Clostridium novyi A str. 4552]|uniref:N-acetylmuramoyl-L-alanine amidase n=2 Tax=Clostridium novyi TaxID=1542 RepID=A0A0A0IDR6_CLONO|nr:N-acetylmuramoyl-L-alanine amidase [Clostridium novyi A str. 4552]
MFLGIMFITLGASNNVFASTYKDMGQKSNVVLDKYWVIKFNKDVNNNTINNSSIVLQDEKGNDISIDVFYNNSRQVTVFPKNKYKPNTNYTLFIKDSVKSTDGKRIKTPVKLQFSTEVAGTVGIKTVSDITEVIGQGANYNLPKTVEAVMSDGSTKNVPVNWNKTSIDTSKSGTFSIEGKVEGYQRIIVLKLVINPRDVTVPKKDFKVVIDPACGGKLSASVGPTGVNEKDVNLAIALKLGNMLRNKGIDVIYTRSNDSVSWGDKEDDSRRIKIANDSNANLFVGVNSNSYNASVNGAETYYCEGNAMGLKLANSVQGTLIQVTGAKDRGVKERNFGILRGIKMPGIIVYPGFITNAQEEKLLKDDSYQNKIAKSIADNVLDNMSGTSSKPSTDKPVVTPKPVEKPKPSVPSKGIKIAIDPGHGGYDSGAPGHKGVLEKNVALAVSLKLGKILENSGMDVVYTRTSDKCPWPSNKNAELQMRCDIANNAKADYFVSIHCNSADTPSASGIETYYDRDSGRGYTLAKNIQNELISEFGYKNRGIKPCGFYVVRHTKMQAVLVELEFISNYSREQILNNPKYQQRYAEAIAKGIKDTIGK